MCNEYKKMTLKELNEKRGKDVLAQVEWDYRHKVMEELKAEDERNYTECDKCL